MKYKLKIWNSDVYSYENAEEQLNNMAQRGYEFRHTINLYLPVAVYKKSQDAQKTRYAIEMAIADDDDFFQLCRDAGWEKGPYIGSDQYILTTKNPEVTPIFSDAKTEYENALRVAQSGNTGCTIFSMMACGVILALATPSAVRFFVGGNSLFFRILFGIIVLMILTGLSGCAANYLYMKKIANSPFENDPQGKPRWIRRMSYSNAVLISMLWLTFWGRGIWQNLFVYQSLLAVILVIIVPLIGIACLYLSAVWNKRTLAFIGLLIINFMVVGNDSVVELLI